MSSDFSTFDIRSIAKLLNEQNPEGRINPGDIDSDDETDLDAKLSTTSVKGPGDIGVMQKQTEKSSMHKGSIVANTTKKTEGVQEPTAAKSSNNDIWKAEEVKRDGNNEYLDLSLISDPRKTPQYDTHYRQSVTTEDVFLQMGNKTPGTASCEDLIVEIHLPDEDYHKVQLDLKKQLLDLSSPIYFLHLGLPHPIDPRAGNAKWDQKNEKLTITLKLSREFDDLNF